jgi:membrane protease YdiL (CAAX protease family)
MRRDGVALFWHIVLGIDLAILAVAFGTNAVIGIQLKFFKESKTSQEIAEALRNLSTADLWAETATTFVLVGVIPFLWALFTRVRPIPGGPRYLGLRNAGPALARGVGIGVLLVIALFTLSALWILIGDGIGGFSVNNTTEESAFAEGLANAMTWPLAIFVAFAAGFGEEVLFRGILQKRLGVWGQGVLFGLVHAGYGTWLQVVVPFALGIAFGLMVKRGWSLWTVIAAHFTFNFIQLALILSVPEVMT